MKHSEYQKQILRKLDKLKKLEEQVWQKAFSSNYKKDNQYYVSSIIYACIDGFVLLRSFSPKIFKPLRVFVAEENIADFVQHLPYEDKYGQTINLSEVFKFFKVGFKGDIGSQGGGITIGNRITIDGFQISIHKNEDIEEISEQLEDLKFILHSKDEAENAINAFFSENQELNSKIKELEELNRLSNNNRQPLIITEGKTDWKYFISALKYFHTKNLFKEIKPDFFLKFGSKSDVGNEICGTKEELEMGDGSLKKFLDALIEVRKTDKKSHKDIRIGIFDSDNKTIKISENTNYNVFSIKIEPDEISTEFLFNENEIKNFISDKRLFVGTEFNKNTKRLFEDSSVNIGGDSTNINKAGKKVIIDNEVYDINGINIALSKDEFAQAIYCGHIQISSESWNNFKHIFEKICFLLNNKKN